MKRKLTEADFPVDAVYTKVERVVSAYAKSGAILWCALFHSVYTGDDAQHFGRERGERDITRAEAIAIVKERGQWEDAAPQPDPIADLRRRVEALEARLQPAPPMPPLPVVPPEGYWQRNGKRYVLTEPVEYRVPNERDVLWLCPTGEKGWEPSYPTSIPGIGYRFILRELIEPDAPQGYVVDGWRKPRKGEVFVGKMGVTAAGSDLDYFRWCLRAVPRVHRCHNASVTWQKPTSEGTEPYHVGPVAIVNHGNGWTIDRERVALEWCEQNGHIETLGMRRRLAEIREGKA